MARSRKVNETQRSAIYSSAPCDRSEMGWPLCVYCGNPADSIDHCPPLSRVDDYRSLGVAKEMYLLLKSCRPCNQLLGATLQEDPIARIEALKRILKKKLGKRDTEYIWGEDELQSLGKNLRRKIVSDIKETENLIQRIDYRGGLRAILGMMKDK